MKNDEPNSFVFLLLFERKEFNCGRNQREGNTILSHLKLNILPYHSWTPLKETSFLMSYTITNPAAPRKYDVVMLLYRSCPANKQNDKVRIRN